MTECSDGSEIGSSRVFNMEAGISICRRGGKCLGQGLAKFAQGSLLQEGISRED